MRESGARRNSLNNGAAWKERMRQSQVVDRRLTE
jgi:hypothetical protein